MNALSLLTKGHTIRGLEERHGPYKILDKNVLPHFSPPKRSVPTSPRLEPQSPQAAIFDPAPGKAETPSSTATTAAPALASDSPRKFRWQSVSWSPLSAKARDWMRTKNPWRKTSNSRNGGVQTELDLDKVKVIRNDLSEYDLEVVPVGNKPAPKPESENQTAHP